MNLLRMIFRLIWIGACALTMLAQTRLLLGLPLAPGWVDGFVLGGAMFAYNFTHPDSRLRRGAWLAGILGGLCFFFSFRAAQGQATVLIPVLLWLLYYGLRRPGNAGLRGVPAAKPVVVALAWAWVTVMLPLPPGRWGEAGLVFIGRSAFVFGLALAYDLVDLAYDRRHGLSTLAANLGFEKTFILINSALGAAVLCCWANFSLKIYGLNMATALTVSLVFSAWQLRLLLQKTACQGWQKVLIDGLMPLQFALVGFGKIVGHIG